jgi:simple sugar transport system ATP-binding protein
VHQSTELVGIPGLTVADALLLNRFVDRKQPFFVSRSRIFREAGAILAEAGFRLPVHLDFAELSAADRQLVAIARALDHKAALLILDEPTASLSGAESQRLYSILHGLKQRGLAILYMSHRTSDLKALADRVVVLRGGRNVGSFTRPIDFQSAVTAMIGRSFEGARQTLRASSGTVVFELRSAKLLPSTASFDLSIARGEVVAIAGVLGAGKSRLLSAIFGAGRLAAGEMRLEGVPYSPASPRQAIDAGAFMMGEDRHRASLMPAGWPGETIAETVALPHLSRWHCFWFIRRHVEQRKAEGAIERLGIRASGPSASTSILSGGNQQKVVLARWEAEPAKLLLLDEPFQGVDVGARHDIIQSIRNNRDRATLIATSDPEEAAEVADRIISIESHTLHEAVFQQMEPFVLKETAL